MDNEQAEIEVLLMLEKCAQSLQDTAKPPHREWLGQWVWRFHTDRTRREFIRQKRANRTRAMSTNYGDKNSYYLSPGERFVELAEAFARRNPRRLVMDRPTDALEASGLSVEDVPGLLCE